MSHDVFTRMSIQGCCMTVEVFTQTGHNNPQDAIEMVLKKLEKFWTG